MTLFRNILKAVDNTILSKRCFTLNKNTWNAETYFGTKVELPLPPKRPLTAYMIFVKEKRKDLIKENPSLSSPQQIKVLAEKWGHLSEEMKKPYEMSARQSTLQYGEEHKKFYESLTVEQKEELARQKHKRLEARRVTRIRREVRESGKPKQPCSAYILFLQDRVKDKPVAMTPVAFIKKVAEEWHSVPEDSKKKYEVMFEKNKVRYAEEMKEWRAKMVSEGREKLLKSFDELHRRGKLAEAEEEVVVPPRKRKTATKKPTSEK